MNEIGQILREARESRGLTLQEVQSELRINDTYLQALEEGMYDVLPTAVHARGYLRNYARFLELDPQPLLDRLVLANGRRPAAAKVLQPPPMRKLTVPDQTNINPDGTFFNPVNVELEADSESRIESVLRVVLIIALIVSIVLVGSRFLNDDRQIDFRDAVTSILASDEGGDSAESALTLDELPESAADSAAAADIQSNPIVSTSRNNLPATDAAASDGADDGVTRTRPALPEQLDLIELRLEVTRRSWLRLTIDDAVEFEGIARQGDVFEYTARRAATVDTGSGGDVFLTINGIELGRLGERNQVVQETWQTTP